MPIATLKYAVRIFVYAMALSVAAVPLGLLAARDAAAKTRHPDSARQRIVKKQAHAPVKAVKLRNGRTPAKRAVKPGKPVKAASLKLSRGPLTLDQSGPATPAISAMRQKPASRPDTNAGELPPLQIGKTLYQRNGEVILRERGSAGELAN